MGENDPPDTWLSPVSSKTENQNQYRVDKKRAVKGCKAVSRLITCTAGRIFMPQEKI